jgi:hypothetical protein
MLFVSIGYDSFCKLISEEKRPSRSRPLATKSEHRERNTSFGASYTSKNTSFGASYTSKNTPFGASYASKNTLIWCKLWYNARQQD